MIRVGIVFGFDETWLGGINYFRNLVNALYNIPNRDIEIVIFTGISVSNDKLCDFPKIEVIRSRLLEKRSFLARLRSLQKRILGKDYLLTSLLVYHRIDVLSHSGWLGRNAKIATIGWIADFQSLRLPDFFTSRELNRNIPEFRRLAKNCTKLIVSSDDALQDLHKFLPEGRHKSAVLHFAIPPISKMESLLTLNELQEKYSFSGDFILLPNQFWKHKNHRVVIDALAMLKEAGLDLLILSTGNTHDYRNPEFFADIESHIEASRVSNHFRVLGMVPYHDLRALMHFALAIINPSLFEGWSTTVEEAKALGKTVILSDIAVHREQSPQRGIFFSPHDVNALATVLRDIWEHPSRHRSAIDAQSIELATIAYSRFAQTYRDIVVSTHQDFSCQRTSKATN